MTEHLDNAGLWTGRSASTITTFSRRRVDPLNISADDIVLEDIVEAIARQARYNGHSFGHLSVARHSIWVAERAMQQAEFDGQSADYVRMIGRMGLMHDGAEAYLGDLVSPLKRSEFGKAYLDVERQVEAAIAQAFSLPEPPWLKFVTDADRHVTVEVEIPVLRWQWDSSYRRDADDWEMLWFQLGGVG